MLCDFGLLDWEVEDWTCMSRVARYLVFAPHCLHRRLNLWKAHMSTSLRWSYAPINVKPAGEGEAGAWGSDLIVFAVPRVGHLTNLVLVGEGIFESFFARRGDGFGCRLGQKRLRPNIRFPTSTLHARDARSGKIWKSWKRTSQRWVDFTILINWSIEKITGWRDFLI